MSILHHHCGLASRTVRQSTARLSSSPRRCVGYGQAKNVVTGNATSITAQNLAITHDGVELSMQELESRMQAFLSGYKHSQHVEHAYWIDDSMVEGEIPAELTGTLLRNGPGLFEVGSKRIAQPFDGDGMVCSFTFQPGGGVYFQNRFVRTEGFLAEQHAGKAIYRSVFNRGLNEGEWLANPFAVNSKNVANTHVVHWGGKTLALWEGGMPHMLDSELCTVGTDDLGGAVDGDKVVAAHHRVVTEAGGGQRLLAFGAATSGADAVVTFWEFDEAGRCLHKTRRTLPGAAVGFFHDMAVTEHFYILFQNPVSMNVWRLFTEYTTGKSSLAECIEFDDKLPVKVILVPRPGKGRPSGPEAMRTLEIANDTFFTFHHVNAYEAADGRAIVVDTCAMPKVDFSHSTDNLTVGYYQDMGNATQLHRVVIDLSNGQCTVAKLSHRGCEFPTINVSLTGKPHSHIYTTAGVADSPSHFSPPQGLWKVSVDPSLGVSGSVTPERVRESVTSEFWAGKSDQVLQEPVFVPRPNGQCEDDGWLLAMVFDAGEIRSELAIFDAQKIRDGPVARIRLSHHVPLGLHGSFTKEVLLPKDEQYMSSARRYDIRCGV